MVYEKLKCRKDEVDDARCKNHKDSFQCASYQFSSTFVAKFQVVGMGFPIIGFVYVVSNKEQEAHEPFTIPCNRNKRIAMCHLANERDKIAFKTLDEPNKRRNQNHISHTEVNMPERERNDNPRASP